jgi:diphosphomevalonate decarboxylase
MQVNSFSNNHNGSSKSLFEVEVQAPANIALIKYWGKKGPQLPLNANCSLNLNQCFTTTKIKLIANANLAKSDQKVSIDYQFYNYKGELESSPHPRLLAFLENAKKDFPWMNQYTLQISSHNNFPHAAGIASSASAFAALALGLCLMELKLRPELDWTYEQIFQEASKLARTGSGSACRSLMSGLAVWGEHPLLSSPDKSSNEFAISHFKEKLEDTQHFFHQLMNVVLIVNTQKKSISSSIGHNSMQGHDFLENRLVPAQQHFTHLYESILSNNWINFGQIVEQEACSLHALMLTARPPYCLMHAHTLEIMQRIWLERSENKLPIYFTLDAGANVHLLYLKSDEARVKNFIENDIAEFLVEQKWIFNQTGMAPHFQWQRKDL